MIRLLAIVLALACACTSSRKEQSHFDLQTFAKEDAHTDEHAVSATDQERHETRVTERDPETTNIIERWDRPVAVEMPDGGVVVAPEHHERLTSKQRGPVKTARNVDEQRHADQVTQKTADASTVAATDVHKLDELEEDLHVGLGLVSKLALGAAALIALGGTVFLIVRFRPWRFLPWIQ